MCNIAYDIIGKAETSTKDMEYINEKVMINSSSYKYVDENEWIGVNSH